MIDEANEILREKGYSAAHLNAVAAPLPGKVLFKGTKILSPFSDTAEVVLRVARDFVPTRRGARPPDADSARDPRLAGRIVIAETALRREQAFVDGRWIDADSGETFPVNNPANGEEIARVPRMGAGETRRALEAAEAAFPGWRARTAADRARILRRWADLMLEHLDDLALLLTLEQGKPLVESEAEIRYAASFLEWFGEEGKRVYGDTIPSPLPDRRILVLKQPVGVSAGITPWNFPSAMPTRKAAPALAAGCTMVLKPAEQTPLSALAVAALGEEAGLPGGRPVCRHR